MSDTPTLTFEPFKEESTSFDTSLTPQAQEPIQDTSFQESSLSPEEQKMVDDFADKIDLSQSNLILQYGAGTQKKLATPASNASGARRRANSSIFFHWISWYNNCSSQ